MEENRTTLSRWTVMGIQKQLPGVSKTQGRGRDGGRGLSLFFLKNSVLGLGLGLVSTRT